jgi:hypothetical protein
MAFAIGDRVKWTERGWGGGGGDGIIQQIIPQEPIYYVARGYEDPADGNKFKLMGSRLEVIPPASTITKVQGGGRRLTRSKTRRLTRSKTRHMKRK